MRRVRVGMGKFGKITNAYEECRADSVALYLSTYKDILEVLFPGREAEFEDIVYVTWYQLLVGSLVGLEFYNPEAVKWGQAHRNGNHVILQVVLEAGKEFVRIKEAVKDGKPYLYFGIDRKQIGTTGKEAIGNFITRLQVYTSMGNAEEGIKMFNGYSVVDERFLNYREIILTHKKPRRIELQDDLKKEGEEFSYVTFAETLEGVIESHLYHYRYYVDDVWQTWRETKDHFRVPVKL